ncbi:hypothetical protein DFA_06098 [Cavenderia fasciculata]|uniref:Nudix hydrolase domain-containing protein n=1 Tax=Cavenderia fasciculata TaxID=261658 RepID=F4PK36_CACFS|nr:uncharacterized protein DFA_06098 [Cavenderia fasciculata]EGG23960.1 hypothetical protein DFA_06098 [Cavenderia fasciculata]|eukprot:XP_004361811.1 hypothetical protein DFA_06098 [Cavenderia fasciculata]
MGKMFKRSISIISSSLSSSSTLKRSYSSFKMSTTTESSTPNTTTTTITIRGKPVTVSVVPSFEVPVETARDAPNFVKWVKRVEAEEQLLVKNVLFQSVDMFGKNVGFLKFKAEVVALPENRPVPGIVFCRGGSVAILVILKSKESNKEYSLLTVQTRVPVGKFSYSEIPAGMLDGSGHFVGVAAKEMKEETGLEVSEEKLIDLTQLAYGNEVEGMYPSPGGCDEFIRLFLFRETLEQAKIDELKNKLTGCLSENESITLNVVPLEDLWKTSPDGKTLSALYLYEKLKIGYSNGQPNYPNVANSYLGVGDTGISHYPSYLGLKMHIRCYANVTPANAAGPIVLFDAGLPFFSTAWVSIIPGVLQNMVSWNISRACFMDRYGYGFSDPSIFPILTQDYVIRLRGSLQAANLVGKYILVGWSWGSIFCQVYSLTFPKDVVGIMTIDGTDSRWGLIPANQQAIIGYTNTYSNFQDELSEGTLGPIANAGGIDISYGFFPNISINSGYTQCTIEASQKIWLTNKYLRTAIQEFNIMVVSSALLNFTYAIKPAKPLKDLPYVNIYQDNGGADWTSRQIFMASLSTNSIAIATPSSHFFPFTNPSSIISSLSLLASKIATNPGIQWRNQ